MKGQIVTWKMDKGFGFIKPQVGDSVVFEVRKGAQGSQISYSGAQSDCLGVLA